MASLPHGRNRAYRLEPTRGSQTGTDVQNSVRSHPEDLAEFDTLQPAVNHLYEAYQEAYAPAERVPDQGAAFVFAHLLELADIGSFSETDSEVVGDMPASTDRHPGEDKLDRLIPEEDTVPWWLAVRFGAQYSLIVY